MYPVYLSHDVLKISSTKMSALLVRPHRVNKLRSRQNCRHFADDIFKWIFWNENVWISLTISLKCILNARINNIPALVQVMAWCRPGDKPLSEPMMVNLLRHICVTRPRWVKCGTITSFTIVFDIKFSNSLVIHVSCKRIQTKLLLRLGV